MGDSIMLAAALVRYSHPGMLCIAGIVFFPAKGATLYTLSFCQMRIMVCFLFCVRIAYIPRYMVLRRASNIAYHIGRIFCEEEQNCDISVDIFDRS